MNANQHRTLVLHYIFKMIHPIGGIVAIYLGYRLYVIGVTGQASLIIDSKDFKAQLLNATPGLFMALGGLVIIGISAWRGAQISSTVQTPKRTSVALANSREPYQEAISQKER